MGTWGTGIFEGDGPLDWSADFCESDPVTFLENSLDVSGDYLDSHAGEDALAAAALIAAALDGDTSDLTEDLADWLEENPDPPFAPLIPRAVEAVDRVLDDDSELRDLWAENPSEYPKWRETVLVLRSRLAG
jgi:hypothetical protein